MTSYNIHKLGSQALMTWECTWLVHKVKKKHKTFLTSIINLQILTIATQKP